MILSDRDIKEYIKRGHIEISGDKLYIGPASVDLHLGSKTKILVNKSEVIIDSKEDNSSMFEDFDFSEKGYIKIYPNEFYVMSTEERIKLDKNVAGFLQGRSSLARLGIQVHCAGFFDPGFEGSAVLEVTNLTQSIIKLYPGMRICQMIFIPTLNSSEIGYGEKIDQKYNNQSGPTLSKLYLDEE